LRLYSKKNYERKKYKARSCSDMSALQIDNLPSVGMDLRYTETGCSTEDLRNKLQLELLNGVLYDCFEMNMHFVGWITSFNEDCQVLRLCKLKCSDTTAKVNFCVSVRPALHEY